MKLFVKIHVKSSNQIKKPRKVTHKYENAKFIWLDELDIRNPDKNCFAVKKMRQMKCFFRAIKDKSVKKGGGEHLYFS